VQFIDENGGGPGGAVKESNPAERPLIRVLLAGVEMLQRDLCRSHFRKKKFGRFKVLSESGSIATSAGHGRDKSEQSVNITGCKLWAGIITSPRLSGSVSHNHLGASVLLDQSQAEEIDTKFGRTKPTGSELQNSAERTQARGGQNEFGRTKPSARSYIGIGRTKPNRRGTIEFGGTNALGVRDSRIPASRGRGVRGSQQISN